ncbi:N-acetylglucosamine-6-phosphate deacetylase isoform X3 [Odontomachus brunneus]|uniref:N-acetylglucosamine-6-phosphate deacetylase isoform X3 n=1 Tax=Odontomachus brunneus TaxID=486640 RepID=UPI0013F26DD6|nr:N-acetylglucosamine-6-phosphate deacetylase isoform X3 [Odontomachus brunneus]
MECINEIRSCYLRGRHHLRRLLPPAAYFSLSELLVNVNRGSSTSISVSIGYRCARCTLHAHRIQATRKCDCECAHGQLHGRLLIDVELSIRISYCIRIVKISGLSFGIVLTQKIMQRHDKTILKQFYNCKILREGKIQLENLWVRNGKIVNPEKIFYDEKIIPDVRIDCNGALISPGFIDLQINGGFGIDFSNNIDNVEKGVDKVAKGLLNYGVTSFCPTIVTSPVRTYHKILPKITKRNGGSHGAGILGVHIEGPFISPSKKGAHPENYIRGFDQGFKSVTDMYGDLNNVCMVTLAPEIPNSISIIEELCKRNIKVSVGHSVANLSEGEGAVKHGASFITHLFNAMLPFHHRDPGLVGLLTSDKIPPGRIIHFGIIADGIHTHPAALRIAHRTHPEGLVLVTDAISALGLEEGIHQLGQLETEIRNGSAYIAGTDTLCGSIAEMSKCVRHFKEATDCTVVEALEAATLHPARVLGIDSYKGVLNFGADADFVLLNDRLEVLSTWISGECVQHTYNSVEYTIEKNVREVGSCCNDVYTIHVRKCIR